MSSKNHQLDNIQGTLGSQKIDTYRVLKYSSYGLCPLNALHWTLYMVPQQVKKQIHIGYLKYSSYGLCPLNSLNWTPYRVPQEVKKQIHIGYLKYSSYGLCPLRALNWTQYRVPQEVRKQIQIGYLNLCLLYTSPSPRDLSTSRMPSSA